MSKENTSDLFYVPTDSIQEDFDSHLELPNNNRILFSGKFGTGKTRFLTEFFENEKRKDKYEVVHLFPVHYSVGSNRDIFEWIKADILLELLGPTRNIGYEFEKVEIPWSWRFWSYAQKNLRGLVSLIASVAEMSDKTAGQAKALELLALLVGQAQKLASEKTAERDDEKEVEEFLKGMTSTPGSTYESNPITDIIRSLVHQAIHISETEMVKREAVLIIDDLDRLDPEHIFRILNIFSAHWNPKTTTSRDDENKFGFDKVVIVCDIENVRSIYHHFYGEKADFWGYISKFYHQQPYDFSIDNYVREYIYNWVNTLVLIDPIKNIKEASINNFEARCLAEIIYHLCSYSQVRIRDLQEKFTARIKISVFENTSDVFRHDLLTLYPSAIKLIQTLIRLFASESNLVKCLYQVPDIFNPAKVAFIDHSHVASIFLSSFIQTIPQQHSTTKTATIIRPNFKMSGEIVTPDTNSMELVQNISFTPVGNHQLPYNNDIITFSLLLFIEERWRRLNKKK